MSGRRGIVMRGLVLPVLAAAAVLAGPVATSAAATTITVQGLADDGGAGTCTAQAGGSESCPSLRDAVNYAEGGSAGTDPTIQLGSGTYTLSGDLLITAGLTIGGTGSEGSGATIIEQTEQDRVISATAPLTLTGLQITGGDLIGADGTSGSANGGSEYGAGIESTSALTLSGVVVTNNTATGGAGYPSASAGEGGGAGGAAIQVGGMLTMSGSTISDNTSTGGAGGASTTNAPGSGGNAQAAVLADTGLAMTASSITTNTAIAGSGGNASAGSGGPGGEAHGGAIEAAAGSVQGSTISHNTVTGGNGGSAGGADENGGAGGAGEAAGLEESGLAVTASTVSDNSAAGGAGGLGSGTGQGGQGGIAQGGGVLIDHGGAPAPPSIVQSTVTGNRATAGAPGANPSEYGGNGSSATGGGIEDGIAGVSATGAALSLRQTTVSGNTAAGVTGGAGSGSERGYAANAIGGGLAAVEGASVTAVNSTLAGNQAQAPEGGGASGATYGGAIHADGTGTTVSLASDTVFGNAAPAAAGTANVAGATFHGGDDATLTLQDTLIAGSEPTGAAVCKLDSGATIVDHGHNLEDDSPATCGLGSGGSDLIGANPQLPASPGANGGSTDTLAPASGSPVIGAGGACTDPLSSGAPLTVDQRGEPRGSVCDIGAFQTQPIKVAGSPTVTGSASPGSTLTCSTAAVTVTGDGVLGSDGSVGTPALSFAWLRDGAPIAGAAGSTYLVGTADRGHALACRETATGAYGSGSATSTGVNVPAATSPPPPPSMSAPKITRVSQSHARWREGKPRKHSAPVGTTFSFTLSTAARLTLSFSTRVTGRRASHHRCVAQTKRNRHAARCTLTVSKGTLSLSGKAGLNRVRFAGHVPGKGTLRRGRYSVVITAKAGGHSSSSKPLSFTVVS